MGELVLLAIALLIGCVLGWIAFFRTLSLSKEIESLHKDVLALKQQGGPLQAQAVSAPEAAPQSAYEEPAEPGPQAPMSEDPAQETQADAPRLLPKNRASPKTPFPPRRKRANPEFRRIAGPPGKRRPPPGR